MKIPPKEVLSRLGLPTETRCEPLGRGLIHRTFLARAERVAAVVQQINVAVFPNPGLLAANSRIVVDCLAAAKDRGDYPLDVARPIGTPVRVGDEFWRATTHIEGTYTIDRADTLERAACGAAAFGSFCAALTDLDPAGVVEVLPGFHDFDARLARFESVVGADPAGRAAGAAEEIDYCKSRAGLGREVGELQDGLPRRVCHNDTKINNLLFDTQDHRPRAVVDLDTCMPGWWMHDFGDIVRTFCPSVDENSQRLDRVGVRDDVFHAVCQGFAEPLAGYLSSAERSSLWLGALVMPLMLGMRFLTDHLEGDHYFHVETERQNLDRARNQFALHRDLASRENQLRPHIQRGQV